MRRAAFVLALLAACGGAPAPPLAPKPAASVAPKTPAAPSAEPETPDAPFRANRPPSGPPPAFTPPRVQALALANGVPVYLVERHDLPVVDVDVVVRGGYGALPHDDFWPGRAVAALSTEGAGKRDAVALADGLAALGATLDVRTGADAERATLKVLAPNLPAALEILGDVVLRPTFPDAELARLKARWKASHEKLKSDRDTIGWNLTEAMLYGTSHAYAHAYVAEPRELDAITTARLRATYARLYARERAALIVVGDTTKETVVPLLEKSFGGWKAAGVAARVDVPPPPAAPASRIALVDLPGASQALVLLAEPAIPTASPDRYAFRVMNAILGGFWMSRLNANLREEKGYSYWVNSGIGARRAAGPFRAGGAMQAEKTGAAVGELLAELRAMRDRDVTAQELAGAKTFMTNFLRGSFERVEWTADSLATLVTFDLSDREWQTQAAAIDALTVADIRRVATTYLHPETIRLLVVGDRAAVEPQLAALGMGPVEMRDVYGRAIRRDAAK